MGYVIDDDDYKAPNKKRAHEEETEDVSGEMHKMMENFGGKHCKIRVKSSYP